MDKPTLTRRQVLVGAGLAGAVAAGGIALSLTSEETSKPVRVLASSSAVERREELRRRAGTGHTVRADLVAAPVDVDLGGRVGRTWAYNGQVPGPTIRCTAGDQLSVEVTNQLPEPTTVHWHGLQLRNDMDGVPHLTQSPIPAGEPKRYTFVAPDPGTYWLHPHVGLQRERGLFAPLIIDDPSDPGDYDVEFVVVLDDWLDGAAAAPDDVLQALRTGGMNSTYQVPVTAGRITDTSDSWQYHVPPQLAQPPPGVPPASPASRLASSVQFPFYLLNGRLPTAPPTFHAKPGQRAKIRIINAAGATVFRVAVGDHRLTVTHTDGFPVQPVTVDTLQIASGERYDLTVTLGDGVFPMVAVAEGKGAQALGVIRTGGGPGPESDAQPAELAGTLLALSDLHATAPVRLDDHSPDVERMLFLTGDMTEFAWRINAETYQPRRPFDGITPLPVHEGQRVRMTLVNQTPMYHPMHLHGHTFQVRSTGTEGASGKNAVQPTVHGTRKDTLMVAPGQQINVDVAADNPGQWLVHCHNAYHLATGMAAMMSYLTQDS